MNHKRVINYKLIVYSFMIAFALSIIPLPDSVKWYRPEWVALVLIYWSMILPERISVGTGWCVGLLVDALRGTLLGQYALAMALVAYLTVQLHQRLRLFPIWQQSMVIFLMIGCSQLLVLWVHGMIGQPIVQLHFFLPTFTSMLIWPWVLFMMRDYSRRFKVIAT